MSREDFISFSYMILFEVQMLLTFYCELVLCYIVLSISNLLELLNRFSGNYYSLFFIRSRMLILHCVSGPCKKPFNVCCERGGGSFERENCRADGQDKPARDGECSFESQCLPGDPSPAVLHTADSDK